MEDIKIDERQVIKDILIYIDELHYLMKNTPDKPIIGNIDINNTHVPINIDSSGIKDITQIANLLDNFYQPISFHSDSFYRLEENEKSKYHLRKKKIQKLIKTNQQTQINDLKEEVKSLREIVEKLVKNSKSLEIIS